MEPLDARRALPCFDEPRFKVPFNVSVTAPQTDKVLFNTQEMGAAPAENGMVRHQFAPTSPLPTYLLAVAVGPYDIVEGLPLPANSVRSRPVPLRGIATVGKGPQLTYALANTRALVEHLENYFGIPYPYDKLDLLAAPGYALGAMENPGLVVYSESILLMERTAGVRQRKNFAATHAHELAHMWFGDYVTPAWWNDIWLNEAFATWMGNKAAAAVFPDLGLERATQTEALWAMASDSLSAARQVRQPIASTADINDAFDAITYSKGGGVLAMIESYVGSERFRDGVRRHMKRFAHGIASSDDFFLSLAEGARLPEAAEALRSFTDQPSVPLLSASIECRNGSPVARLSQSTYRPLGSSLPDRQWRIPACMAVYGTGRAGRACTLLSNIDAEVPLPATSSCTSALLPNADGAGYYRFTLNDAGWQSLLMQFERLTAAEQIASIDSLAASYRAGQIPPAQVLNGIAKAGASTDLDVMMSGIDLAFSLAPLIPKEGRAPLEVFLVRVFGPRLTALKSSATPQGALARTRLMSLLGFFANDPGVRAQLHAAGRIEVGLARGTRPERDLLRLAIGVLTEEGGRTAFDAALAQARASNDELYRSEIVSGLARAQTPESRVALWDALMDKPFGNAEMFSALSAGLGHPDNAEQVWGELEQRLASMSQRFPPFIRGTVPQLASGLCSQAAADRVQTYFTTNAASFPDYERSLAQALERIAHCTALRARDNGALLAAAETAK
jgi:alanyl aminopeptidase